jgi:predicted amidohydrolase YtcJ
LGIFAVAQQQRVQQGVAASFRREGSLLIHNARIYLFDEADTIANVILIDHGRVTAAGPEEDLRRRARGAVENWNARGATVLPGLIDTHPHLLHFAARRAGLVDITSAVSHEDIVSKFPNTRATFRTANGL